MRVSIKNGGRSSKETKPPTGYTMRSLNARQQHQMSPDMQWRTVERGKEQFERNAVVKFGF